MKVTVICNGQKEVWSSRKKAMDFYFEGMMSCDGSEGERYAKIYGDLASGAKVATDEY